VTETYRDLMRMALATLKVADCLESQARTQRDAAARMIERAKALCEPDMLDGNSLKRNEQDS